MAQRRTGVIGVFPSEREAQEAARAAQRAGADPSVIRIGDRSDHVTSLQAEMHDEMEQSVMGPGNVGPFTKEMSKAMVPATVIGMIVGALVGLPFAAIHFGGLDAWARILIVVLVGAAVGATVGFQIGGMYGAKRPEEPLGAERGVTIAIDDAPPGAIDALKAMHPIRLDTVEEHGRPTGTVTTEEPRGMRGVVGEVKEHVTNRDLEGG
jgi:hypothetical protein